MLFLSLSPIFSTQDSEVILLLLIPPISWPIREVEVAVSPLFWVVSQMGIFPLVALVSVGLGCLRRIFVSSVPSSCISLAHPLGLLDQMPASPAASPALNVRIYHLSTSSHAYRGFEIPICSPYFICLIYIDLSFYIIKSMMAGTIFIYFQISYSILFCFWLMQ